MSDQRAIDLAQLLADEGVLSAIVDDIRRMTGVVVVEVGASTSPYGLSLALHASTLRYMVEEALVRLRLELAP